MNILIQLSHPAQFHLFKGVAKQLMAEGYNVHILIKTKDILEDLLRNSGLHYSNILPEEHRKNRLTMFGDLLIRDWRIWRFSKKYHIDMLIGSTVEIAQVGWLLRKPHINIGEDDASIVPLFVKMVRPFIQTYLAPVTCKMDSIEPKTIHYAGFHKLAYLHPNRFVAEKSVVAKYFCLEKPYFLLRFAKLRAYHDLGANAQGINTEIAQHLIDMLLPYGDVYITSERELEPQFEKYRLQINPLDIHHVMAFASLYIGDSQSMAVEAAMLGTPSIRFNDFVGKIGVLEELEHKYQLTVGISPSRPQQLYDKIEEWLTTPNLKDIFQQRRQQMLNEKIDVTSFFTWFIEKYPESLQIMKENPGYQYQFK